MKRKILLILLVICLGALTACGNSDAENESNSSAEQSEPEATGVTEETIDDNEREELFLTSYDAMLQKLELLSSYSDYVGAVHSTVWNNVGVDEVAKYIRYVRESKENNYSYLSLLRKALGDGDIWASEYEAKQYAGKYNESMDAIIKLIPELETSYTALNKDYGKDYNIDDLKAYYIECVTYAEYASTIDGSYLSYNKTLNDFQTNVEKLKKSAEMAY